MLQNVEQSLLFDDQFTLQCAELSSDGRASYTGNWVDLLSSVKGRFTNTTNSPGRDFGGATRDVTHRLYCRTNQVWPSQASTRNVPQLIRENGYCRVVRENKSSNSNRYFEVMGVGVDMGERGRITRIDLRERDESWVVK